MELCRSHLYHTSWRNRWLESRTKGTPAILDGRHSQPTACLNSGSPQHPIELRLTPIFVVNQLRIGFRLSKLHFQFIWWSNVVHLQRKYSKLLVLHFIDSEKSVCEGNASFELDSDWASERFSPPFSSFVFCFNPYYHGDLILYLGETSASHSRFRQQCHISKNRHLLPISPSPSFSVRSYAHQQYSSSRRLSSCIIKFHRAGLPLCLHFSCCQNSAALSPQLLTFTLLVSTLSSNILLYS